jgi:hypothetical protein
MISKGIITCIYVLSHLCYFLINLNFRPGILQTFELADSLFRNYLAFRTRFSTRLRCRHCEFVRSLHFVTLEYRSIIKSVNRNP